MSVSPRCARGSTDTADGWKLSLIRREREGGREVRGSEGEEREGERGEGGGERKRAAYKTSGLQYITICISSALWETFSIIG